MHITSHKKLGLTCNDIAYILHLLMYDTRVSKNNFDKH